MKDQYIQMVEYADFLFVNVVISACTVTRGFGTSL